MVLDDGLKVADVCRDQNLGETAVRRLVDQLKAEHRGTHEAAYTEVVKSDLGRKLYGFYDRLRAAETQAR